MRSMMPVRSRPSATCRPPRPGSRTPVQMNSPVSWGLRGDHAVQSDVLVPPSVTHARVVRRQRAGLGDLADAVVGAEHVQHVDEVARVVAVVLRTEQRLRHRPRRIGGVADVGQGHRGRELRRQPVADLVADAVEDDARVIAIALDRVGQIGRAPTMLNVVPPKSAAPCARPGVEELVHHHEAHAVGEVAGTRASTGCARCGCALMPICLICASRRCQARIGTAAPRPLTSWCMPTPLSFSAGAVEAEARCRGRT